MLNFDFSVKSLGPVSPPQFWYFSKGFGTSLAVIFCVWFFKKNQVCQVIYSIIWPDFIVWLPLPLEILNNLCIAIISFQVCYIINFEINFSFLIKPFSYMTKKVRTKNPAAACSVEQAHRNGYIEVLLLHRLPLELLACRWREVDLLTCYYVILIFLLQFLGVIRTSMSTVFSCNS